MGARPRHRQGRDRNRNPAEPDGPTGTILEVSYDCSPSNLYQVQPLPLSQCVARGLRTQEHTTHTHTGNGSHAVHSDDTFDCMYRRLILVRMNLPAVLTIFSEENTFWKDLTVGIFLQREGEYERLKHTRTQIQKQIIHIVFHARNTSTDKNTIYTESSA